MLMQVSAHSTHTNLPVRKIMEVKNKCDSVSTSLKQNMKCSIRFSISFWWYAFPNFCMHISRPLAYSVCISSKLASATAGWVTIAKHGHSMANFWSCLWKSSVRYFCAVDGFCLQQNCRFSRALAYTIVTLVFVFFFSFWEQASLISLWVLYWIFLELCRPLCGRWFLSPTELQLLTRGRTLAYAIVTSVFVLLFLFTLEASEFE